MKSDRIKSWPRGDRPRERRLGEGDQATMTMKKPQGKRKAAVASDAAQPGAAPAARRAAEPKAQPAAKRGGAKARPLPPAPKILQLRIALVGIEPPIWRSILVPDDFTFEDLDVFVRSAMGWSCDHLHGFRQVGKGGRLGDEIDEAADLGSILSGAKQRVAYEYDFGDGWLHEIAVETVLPFESKRAYPACLDGARACPPEDCGGVYGYDEVLKALKKPTKANADLREWIGKYDPEAFSAAKVNRLWASWRKPRRR